MVYPYNILGPPPQPCARKPMKTRHDNFRNRGEQKDRGCFLFATGHSLRLRGAGGAAALVAGPRPAVLE